MMSIPPEYMSRRGSLESRAGPLGSAAPTTDTTKHTRTQSLKERLLNRRLPRKIGIDDVTGGGEIPQKAGGGLQSNEKILLSSSCQAVGDGGNTAARSTTTTNSSTITRWSSFRDAIVRRNDSHHSSDVRLDKRHSPKVVAPPTLNIQEDKSNSLEALASRSIKDQLSGSTPILFSKRQHTLGSASPTPLPRIRRARSEAERAGSFRHRKGPPPLPPSPTTETPPQLSSPPHLSPPEPFPFSEPVILLRRSSDQSQDEGVILVTTATTKTSPAPSPASVVRALAPLFAPVFAVAALKSGMTNKTRSTPKLRGTGKSDSDSGFEMDSNIPTVVAQEITQVAQADFEKEYDIVQKVGEGWFSRVYLTEHRQTREEIVLKAINRSSVSADEFLREFHNSYLLSAHNNVLTIYDVVFQVDNYYMFATEYAPLGDLTSNVGDNGIGETGAKRVTQQIGSALEWVHSKNLCHLDVKLDNILVFDSDFCKVKLCDFGSVRSQGDIVIKKNELLPYCPAELVAKHANEYYQVDRVQDVFQFGIVVFFCLFGILPWQRADAADPNFAEFLAWRRKRTSKIPKNFKPMSSRGQKLFRKLLDPDATKRLKLSEIPKYTEDKWLRGRSARSLLNLTASSALGTAVGTGQTTNGRPDLGDSAKFLSDGISQLTMGSFQSVHSNAVEKNRILFTLLQHGVETTVDRSQKNSRIINWICHGQGSEPEGSGLFETSEVVQPDGDNSSDLLEANSESLILGHALE